MSIYSKKFNETLGLIELEKNTFYGVYKGYEVTIVVTQQLFVHLSFYSNANVKAQAAKIFQTTTNQTLTKTDVSVYGIVSMVNGMTFNSVVKKVVEKLDATIKYLSENEAKGVGYCPCCGEASEELKRVRVNDVYVSLDQACYDEVMKVALKEEEHYNNQPNNYLKGFIGALLGAFVGAVSWVILYFMGFMSALTAVLAVFLGNYFYVKLGGKANKTKNVIVAVVSLAALVGACVGIYYTVVNGMIIEYNLNTTPFEYIFSDSELKSAFIYDMSMNVVFTLIGVAVQIFTTHRKDKSSRTRISQ